MLNKKVRVLGSLSCFALTVLFLLWSGAKKPLEDTKLQNARPIAAQKAEALKKLHESLTKGKARAAYYENQRTEIIKQWKEFSKEP